MEKKNYIEADSNFMSTNGALATHAIWNNAIKSDTNRQGSNLDEDSQRRREEQIQKLVSREVRNIMELGKSDPTSGNQYVSCKKCGESKNPTFKRT